MCLVSFAEINRGGSFYWECGPIFAGENDGMLTEMIKKCPSKMLRRNGAQIWLQTFHGTKSI